MRQDAVLALGFVALLTQSASAATAADIDAFIAEAATLKGQPFSIRTSNGPLPPEMTAAVESRESGTLSITTTVKKDDGTIQPMSEETYRFTPGEAGLMPNHFKTLFTRTFRGRTLEFACDSFFFVAGALQLDCYRPDNYEAKRTRAGPAATIIWEIRPDSVSIRVLADGGAAILTAKRP